MEKEKMLEKFMLIAAMIAVTAAIIMIMAYCSMVSAIPLKQKEVKRQKRQNVMLSDCALIYSCQRYLADENAPRRVPVRQILRTAGNDVRVIRRYEEGEGYGYSPRQEEISSRLFKKSLRTAFRSGDEGSQSFKDFKNVKGTTYLEYLKLRSDAYASAYVRQHSQIAEYK